MIEREPWGDSDPFTWWAEQMLARRLQLHALRAAAAEGREPAAKDLLDLDSAIGRLWACYRLACDWYAGQWEAVREVSALPLPETLPADAWMLEGISRRHPPRFRCSCQQCLVAYLHHVLETLKAHDEEAGW